MSRKGYREKEEGSDDDSQDNIVRGVLSDEDFEEVWSGIFGEEDDPEVAALSDAFAAKASIPIIAADEAHYNLLRTSSGMSNYSDLLEDILKDHGVVDLEFGDDAGFYEEVIVVKGSEEKERLKQGLDYYEKGYKGAKKKSDKASEIKKREAEAYQAETRKIRDKIKPLKDELVPLKDEDKKKKMHLFRGKNLISKFMDPHSGKLRMRDRKEVYEYVTRKYNKRAVLSDGLEMEKDVSQEKKAEVRAKVRKYLNEIKSKSRLNTLFNAGPSYTKAVGELKELTELSNNPVVATSKFPWVASEYGVGQMGGASGGGRGVDLGSKSKDMAVGYDKDKRPVNRVLANAFAVSISLQDYESLRRDGDLVDVNSDVGFGVEPNRMIEEVTFNLEIDSGYVAGSLPLVLPRLDRDYDKMSEEKKRQYERIFGLDEVKYKKLQKYISQDKVEIGKITEHMIRHHGSLLRAIAIKRDRAAGYDGGKFAVPYNSAFKGGINAIHTPYGESLAKRAARTGSATKSSPHVEDGGSISSQILRIRRDECYADDELNNIFSSHLPQNVSYINPAIAATEDLQQAVVDFQGDANKTQAVIAIAYQGHFTAIYIKKTDDGGYEIVYFDPIVVDNQPYHQIPDNVAAVIADKFTGIEVKNSASRIQYSSFQGEALIVDNLHCGAFIVYFLIEMCHGNIRLNEDDILEVNTGDDWKEIVAFNKEQSSEFGKIIRGYHIKYLSGNLEESHQSLLVNFLQDIAKDVGFDKSDNVDKDDKKEEDISDFLEKLEVASRSQAKVPKQQAKPTYAEVASRSMNRDK